MDTKMLMTFTVLEKNLEVYKNNLKVKCYEVNINEVLENIMEYKSKSHKNS